MPQFLPFCSESHSSVHWLASILTSISTEKDTGLCVKPFNVLKQNSLHQPHRAIPEESQPWKGWHMDQQKIEWSASTASRCKQSRPPWVGYVLGATSALSAFRSRRQPKSPWGPQEWPLSWPPPFQSYWRRVEASVSCRWCGGRNERWVGEMLLLHALMGWKKTNMT